MTTVLVLVTAFLFVVVFWETVKLGQLRTSVRWHEYNGEDLTERLQDSWAQIERLQAQLRSERGLNEDFSRRRVRDFDRRVAELIRQNQDLAEKLATLTMERGAVVESGTGHVEDEGPREPFPEAVGGFLAGIENPEARAIVEEQIYRLRDVENLGWDDILVRVRRGG